MFPLRVSTQAHDITLMCEEPYVQLERITGVARLAGPNRLVTVQGVVLIELIYTKSSVNCTLVQFHVQEI